MDPSLQVVSNGKAGKLSIPISGYLYLHYRPPVDWEPEINLDMSIYSHKSRTQSVNLQFIIDVKFYLVTVLK